MNLTNLQSPIKLAPTARKQVDTQATRANAAEELVASIRRENSTEEKFASILRDKHSIKNRISKIKKIQDIQKLLLNNEEAENLAKHLQQNSGSRGRLGDALSEHNQASPMLRYAALDSSLKSANLSDKARKTIESVKEEFLEEYSSYILAWSNSVGHVNAQIKDPKLADSVLTLISQSSQEKTGFLEVYQKILEVAGEDKFAKVATAYTNALTDDLSHRTPSADPAYLANSLNQISEVGAAHTIFALSQDKVEKVKSKFPYVEKTNVDFLRATLQVMQNPSKKNISNVAAGFVGFGAEKKYVFTDTVLALASQLPQGTWEDEKHKDKIITSINNVLGRLGHAFSLVESDMRRRIETVDISDS